MSILHAILSAISVPVNAAQINNPTDINTIGDLINRISGFIQPVSIIALIACVLAAGFVRLTSAGNSEKEAQSMKILTSAAIGFAIIALAPLIVNILLTLFKVNSNLTL